MFLQVSAGSLVPDNECDKGPVSGLEHNDAHPADRLRRQHQPQRPQEQREKVLIRCERKGQRC